MQPFFVIITYHAQVWHMVVNARYHEEAEREALLMMKMDFTEVDSIRACPLIDNSNYVN